ncbi:hypothetical protein SOCEGT47_032650 [Sorangium cellulosum]|uniref:Uncharacterized protein n=1 Tax=Sorangium cellulosum TaxID=56 RepID=A0A4P2Q0N3_SORCE|nr:hypothetical protein [Sorangium cellulosum]AUX22755.1 hypothetical protein SOCEGT47_032650 [Sorangium cellulosum]
MEASQRPIPPPHDEDDEDVHWALSTATALWGRGEREEALRWLRRAAEQASDANADLRALELFKAAAEVAQKIAASDAAPAAGAAAPTASAPPLSSGAAATSTPPPWPGAPVAATHAAHPSRPPAGVDAGRTGRGGASASAPPRAPSVRAPAGSAPPAPSSARPPPRDAGALRPAAGLGRPPQPVAPGWGAVPTKPVAGRGAHPAAAPRVGDPPAGATSTAVAHGRAALARAGAIVGFAASSNERMSSTTAVTEEVPAVKHLPASASQERGQGAPGAALQGASAEQLPIEGELAADQRETVPTDLAVALMRQGATPVGASSSEVTERRERDWSDSDDEGTTRRTLSGQVQRALRAHRTEDPDEETPLLGQGERAGNGEGGAARSAAPAGAPMGAEALGERAGWVEPDGGDDDSADQHGEATLTMASSGAAQGQRAEGPAASWLRAAAKDDRESASVEPSWDEREPPFDGAWQAPPPRLPAAQIEPLPALRMAVIGISSAGELRLVPMDGRNAPPRGAALGIFVPLSAADGETIARLLQLRG